MHRRCTVSEDASLPTVHIYLPKNIIIIPHFQQTCGGDPCATERRLVECLLPDGGCDVLTRPPHQRRCGNITCGTWTVGPWTQVSLASMELKCLTLLELFDEMLEMFMASHRPKYNSASTD
jgi:hypothetical protein